MSPGVEPRMAASQSFHIEIAPPDVFLIHRGDFQFSAGRWFHGFGDTDDVTVVKIPREIKSTATGARIIHATLHEFKAKPNNYDQSVKPSRPRARSIDHTYVTTLRWLQYNGGKVHPVKENLQNSCFPNQQSVVRVNSLDALNQE